MITASKGPPAVRGLRWIPHWQIQRIAHAGKRNAAARVHLQAAA